MATEVKEEVVLIAKRRPPGDQWVLLLDPNHIYPSFNTGMSYTSFFASAIIPLILLTSIYNYFKNKVRTGTFKFAKIKGNESTE
jgi:hypothetical protein